MDIQHSMELSWWEALPKLFMIQHTEDGAEAAICATMKPPAK